MAANRVAVDHVLPIVGQPARQLVAGRVVINGAPHDPHAPFGGFRQSGLGREIGAYGLDAYLEPRAILKPAA
ncbi:aldehyde dehydrogenase family protein [Novosphingobium lindaniclasticum]|uniref:Aldehyde dehydrogenase domain-containing protein n=1 Tax=Novosphingobium lindaniclasticum LE124 TaxID=1096930 RepID=T0HTP6_9SPHN|nr:aldehyde dehydrogenase family protein [Novosphingobium lindaniclasticum]EQB16482.1 hypothetical protein L284_09285 [Novosphingobium lindaniclasticum LE124]